MIRKPKSKIERAEPRKGKCFNEEAREREENPGKKRTPRRQYQSMKGGPRRVMWEHAVARLETEQMSITSRDLAALDTVLCSSNFPIGDHEGWRRRRMDGWKDG